MIVEPFLSPELKDVIFGIKSARKGWLTRQDLLNTLPLKEVETALQLKRQTLL